MNEKLKNQTIELLQLFRYVLEQAKTNEKAGFKEKYLAKSKIKEINKIIEEIQNE